MNTWQVQEGKSQKPRQNFQDKWKMVSRELKHYSCKIVLWIHHYFQDICIGIRSSLVLCECKLVKPNKMNQGGLDNRCLHDQQIRRDCLTLTPSLTDRKLIFKMWLICRKNSIKNNNYKLDVNHIFATESKSIVIRLWEGKSKQDYLSIKPW